MFGRGLYNPYMYQPFNNVAGNLGGLSTATRSGLGLNTKAASMGLNSGLGLKGLLGKFSFSGFLNGASKTLNFVNQAIPAYYQIKPIVNNAKTMFKIMGAVNKDDKPKNKTNNNITQTQNIKTPPKQQETNSYSEENPTFFL